MDCMRKEVIDLAGHKKCSGPIARTRSKNLTNHSIA